MEYIAINNLKKDFVKEDSTKLEVLSGINLGIEKGSFVTIFGPNGSGKSTFLNIVAGILEALPKPKIGYVFQDPKSSLLLWKKVWYNIGISKIWQGGSKDTVRGDVKNLIDSLELKIDLDVYPFTLSGGQLQLVCILRGLFSEPDILLLDEPFSALDYLTKLKMQIELQRISKKLDLTCIMISHDIDEAIFVGDQVVLFSSIPTSVIDVINNKAGRPRDLSFLSSDQFLQVKKQVFKSLDVNGNI